MSDWHLAQINIGRFRQAPDHPDNADFMAALDHVNSLAEASQGFVWRLTGEGSNNATDIRPFDDPMMAVNMSVWESLEALAAFAYRNMDHRSVMRRRREWFEETPVYMALWWVPAGHTPTPAEGREKLELLARFGPTSKAFMFKQPFPPPGGEIASPVLDECA
jgi:Domain of unknown function (DUF3291)